MGANPGKNSFGQTVGALLLILAIVFVFGCFVLRHQFEKRDIDVTREFEAVKEAAAEKVAELKRSGAGAAELGGQRAEELRSEAAAALPDADDFEGANDEAGEFFVD